MSLRRLGCHMFGDYLLQSNWMAMNKTKNNRAAAIHAVVYSLPFLTLKPSAKAYAGIIATHYLIDRYRLARYVIWAKEYLAPLDTNHTLTPTGYAEGTPDWLATSLLIITDNTLHVLINGMLLGDENEY